MTDWPQRRLALAVLWSLLLHLLLLGSPGWHVPMLDDLLQPGASPQLEAHLVLAAPRKIVAPAAKPVPPQRKPFPRGTPEVPAVQVAAATPDTPATPNTSLEASRAEPLPADPPGPIEAVRPVVAEAPPEQTLPRRGSIRFVISRGDRGFVIGQSLHRWSHDDQSYTLSSVTETTGIAAVFRPARVLQSSEGEIGVAGLRPSKFRTEKNGIAGDAAAFDWTGMSLRLVPGGGIQRAEPLVSGAQDMLSMFYQFSALYPRMPREFNEIMVATGRKFERYAFSMLREEILETKLGAMRTLHLRTAAGVEAIDIWMGLDLRGLPLKIRYTDREGESYDQVAEDIEFEGR